jgi:hypothetical protein
MRSTPSLVEWLDLLVDRELVAGSHAQYSQHYNPRQISEERKAAGIFSIHWIEMRDMFHFA